jgi:DNA polymerase-1
VLAAHVAGEQTVGVPPAADGVARKGVIDVDLHVEDREPAAEEIAENETYAKKKYSELQNLGIKALLLRNNKYGSYHILFFVMMVAAALGRWLQEFVADAGSTHVDTFPAATGGGNAVRLPGRHHRRPGQWSAVWDGITWVPWPAAIRSLLALPFNPASLFPDPGGPTKQSSRRTSVPSRYAEDYDARESTAVTVLASVWPNGHRHDMALVLAGALLSAGVERDRTERILRAVCAAAGDKEVENRVRCIDDTVIKLAAGKPVTAWPRLAELIGERGEEVASTLRQLLVPRKIRAAQQVNAAPAYKPFPVEVLPPVPRRFVANVAAAMNCDPAYVALPVLALLAAAIGTSHVAGPKKGWQESVWVWALPIGRSGTGKSPPCRLVEDIAEDLNDRLETEYQGALAVHKARLNEWDAADDTDEEAGEKPEPPVKRTFKMGDVTIEAAVCKLQDSPRGCLVAQDELSTFFAAFARYSGHTGATSLGQWLQLHSSGVVSYSCKTGDRREIRVRGVGVSLTGTTQPGILRRFMTEEYRKSGLLARLLLAMPPFAQRVWTEAEVDEATREELAKLVNDLYALPQGSWPSGGSRPHLVRLSDEAKTLFIDFFNANGEVIATAEEDMAAARSKLEGYALRFALIFHLCRLKEYGKDTKITPTDMTAAIRLTKWFGEEAERVYAVLGQTTEQQTVQQLYELVSRLADRLAPKRNGFRGVTPRDLQNSNAKKYPTQPEAEAALESLVAAGLGDWSDGPNTGRAGGHRPRYFVTCPTPDASDTRPDDNSDPQDGDPGGSSDTRPDEPPPPAPGTTDTADATDGEREISGAADVHNDYQVSEVSDVGRGPEAVETECVSAGSNAATDVSECRTPVAGTKAEPTVVTITTTAGLPAVVSAVKAANGTVGLDIETTGLDPRIGRVRLLQIATPTTAYVIDLFAVGGIGALTDLFTALTTVEVLGHTLQFELHHLKMLGFEPGRLYDTQLASQVLHAGRVGPKNTRLSHKLKDVVKRELGRDIDKTEQTSDWAGDLTAEQIQYAALDAAILLPLAANLKEKLAAAKLTTTAELEMRALQAIASLAGVPVDRAAWAAQTTNAAAERDRLSAELNEIDKSVPPRNWNSPAQVTAALKAVGIKVKSTADDTLATIDHPLATKLREYRAAAKRVSSYGAKWAAEHVRADGRVHASWWQCGQVTGRIGCSVPNHQQLPKAPEVRRCIAAPPGSVLITGDYSQIELRIAAKIANESVMLEAYRVGADLHTRTAAAILGKPEPDVTKADRQLAKAINFGLLYGMGVDSFRVYARTNYGVDLAPAQAREYRDKFFKTYPGLRRWHRSINDRLIDTRTLGGRRRVGVTRFTEKLNSPVQGTGADGLKAAIALLWERRDECPRAVPILFVHDEIVVEVPEADADAAKQWLVRAMEDGMRPLLDPVPVAVEATIGRTWAGD